jgi:dTDP-glucose pyrophosphorylase
MNIVIPMAGLGTRFPKQKYKKTKPLIDILNKPMIQWAIESLNIKGKYHFVVRKEDSEEITNLLRKIVPDCEIILIEKTTSGPAESVLLFEKFINNDEELIVANCDQIMWWDSEQFLLNARSSKYDGMIVTYHADTPKNSYAKLNCFGMVIEIKEKEVISHVSLNGIHYWKKGRFFVESANLMKSAKDTAPNGEYYVGPTYNYMIKQMNKIVGIYHIPNFQHNPVGVPEDLERFISKVLYEENQD